MKKLFSVPGMSVIILFVALFTSCTKPELEEIKVKASVIFTDNPPEALFAKGTAYGTTNRCWIDQTSIKTSKNQGNLCTGYQDQWGNVQWSECGLWHLISVKKYWGTMGNTQYMSKSVEWIAINSNNYLVAIDAVKRKDTAIGQLCTGCQNPVGGSTVIAYVEQ